MALYPITVNTPVEALPHIYAEDDAAIYESISGGDGVYDIGEMLKATVLSNNNVRIGNGVLSVGGHIARIKYGDYEEMTIDNGESEKNRNDLIVARFSTTGFGGVDEFSLEVKKGVAVTGAAKDPEVETGNLYEGETIREFPLHRVRLEGISIVAVDQLFAVRKTNEQLQKEVDELNRKLVFLDQNAQNSSVNGWTLIRNGNIVTFKHNKVLSGVIAGHSYSNQGKIPEGYRPAIDITLPGDRIIGATITGSFYVSIGPAGNTNFVSDGNHNENQSYVASGAYITSDLFPLNDIPKVEI